MGGKAWLALRAEVAAEYRGQNRPCGICFQAIDYTAPANTPEALDVDHIKTRAARPDLELDRSNLRPAHVRCNRSRGPRDTPAPIGTVTEDW